MSYFRSIYAAPPDELPHRARAVYMYLKDRAGKGTDCWPAVNTIAADMQLSLTRFGLIEKEARFRENGSHTSNRLILKED